MDIVHAPYPPPPVIHKVNASAPFTWLMHAALDMRRAPLSSLFYGAAFVVMGWLLSLYFRSKPEIGITLAAAFLLLGPFLSLGLYAIARELEKRGDVSLKDTLTAWRANLPGITLFAALLAVAVFAWFRISLLMFALFYTDSIPTLDHILRTTFSGGHVEFLIAWFGVGLLFAIGVFAISVVSIPMMLDRDVDTVTAMLTSMRASYKNLPAMVVWALLIAVLTAIGFATMMIGLLVLMPLVALASWHAYRALVE